MDDKNKKIYNFLQEFNMKIDCCQKIFYLLENIEKDLNNKVEDNKEMDYPANLVKLSLVYSLNQLYKKKAFYDEIINKKYKMNNNGEEESQNEIKENIKNTNNLIKELEKIIYKINNYEIDISELETQNIHNSIISKIKKKFRNLFIIFYKSKLYRYFYKFHKLCQKIGVEEDKKKIDKFLEHNYNIITQQGMDLVKINYGSKGHKTRFYKLDPDSNTFNAREMASQQYPTHSYKIFKDVIKIVYGVKSPNLIKKLAAKKDKDTEAIKLLKKPRNILSIITKKRS